jgi:dienelactone hydrolase
VARGWAALVVDSFGPREWGARLRRWLIEPGLIFRGRRRAGDVLAAIEAARRMPVVDARRMVVAGVGHGAWAVLELLAQPLDRRGEVRIADADQADLAGVKGAVLVEPRLSRRTAITPWPRRLRLDVVLARGADARPTMRVLAPALAGGCDLVLGAETAPPTLGRLDREEALGLAAAERLGAALDACQPSTTTSPLKELAT